LKAVREKPMLWPENWLFPIAVVEALNLCIGSPGWRLLHLEGVEVEV